MHTFRRMIYQIIAITLKELKVLWLDREALALLFAMPMSFILVMSFALEGVFEAGSKAHPIEILNLFLQLSVGIKLRSSPVLSRPWRWDRLRIDSSE